MAEGIEVRHARSCASRAGRRCNCEPGYRVAAYDAMSKRKVSKTFRTLAEARRWRAGGARRRRRRAFASRAHRRRFATPQRRSSTGWRAAAIRTRTGDRYKPSVVREYERSLRLHVLPTLGGAKLSKIQRRDVQALVTRCSPPAPTASTIRNALKPLRVIYRRRSRTATSPSTRASGSGSLPHVVAASGSPRRPRPRRSSPPFGPRTARLWGCAFYAGLRRGELRALLWDDVDLAARADPRRAQHEQLRRGRRAEEPRRPTQRSDRRRAPRPPRRAQARHAAATTASSSARARRRRSRPTVVREASADRVAASRARADRPARVPAHLRQPR